MRSNFELTWATSVPESLRVGRSIQIVSKGVEYGRIVFRCAVQQWGNTYSNEP